MSDSTHAIASLERMLPKSTQAKAAAASHQHPHGRAFGFDPVALDTPAPVIGLCSTPQRAHVAAPAAAAYAPMPVPLPLSAGAAAAATSPQRAQKALPPSPLTPPAPLRSRHDPYSMSRTTVVINRAERDAAASALAVGCKKASVHQVLHAEPSVDFVPYAELARIAALLRSMNPAFELEAPLAGAPAAATVNCDASDDTASTVGGFSGFSAAAAAATTGADMHTRAGETKLFLGQLPNPSHPVLLAAMIAVFSGVVPRSVVFLPGRVREGHKLATRGSAVAWVAAEHAERVIARVHKRAFVDIAGWHYAEAFDALACVHRYAAVIAMPQHLDARCQSAPLQPVTVTLANPDESARSHHDKEHEGAYHPLCACGRCQATLAGAGADLDGRAAALRDAYMLRAAAPSADAALPKIRLAMGRDKFNGVRNNALALWARSHRGRTFELPAVQCKSPIYW